MLDVGVVGGGTAGAATALFLSRAGHRVTVYECVPDPKPVGAGIILQPTGQAVLARLGLDSVVRAKTARIDELLCLTATGRTVVKLRYDELGRPDLFGLGTHRGVLFETLFEAARAECEVRCGVSIDSLSRERRRTSRGVRPTVDDERIFLVDDGGRRHGPHDMIVVADGAKSRLRDDVPIPMRVRPYEWGAIWFLARDRERLFRDQLLQIVRSNARMLGFLPTGLGPGLPSAQVEPVTSVYWSVRGDLVASLRRAGAKAWKDDVRALLTGAIAEKADALLEQITDMDQLLYAQYHDVEMRSWAHERVVFLGDAAHATSPQLGQGCNLALVDALVLAECVHAFVRDRSGIDRALDAYSARRARHLGVYQQATRWLTPFFQGDIDALAELRDVFMPLSMKLPFARKMMAQSMAGMLGSWLGAEHPLPARESEVPGRVSTAARRIDPR